MAEFARCVSKRGFPELKLIELYRYRIGNLGLLAIAEAADEREWPRLDRLTLHDNWMGDEGVDALAHSLDIEHESSLHCSVITLYDCPGISEALRARTRGRADCEFVYASPNVNETTRPQWGDFEGTSSDWIPEPEDRRALA